MLKYKEIIGRMSMPQKIRMLCDITALSEKEYAELGIPELKIAYFEGQNGSYPSPYALANSWDTELMRKAAKDIVCNMAKNGVALLVLPWARANFNPYSKALAEDGLLSSSLAGEVLNAAEELGICACVTGFGITETEVEWLDEKPNGRIIYEQIVNPYIIAAEKGGFDCIASPCDLQNKNYEKVNGTLLKIAARDKTLGAAVPVCEKASAESTVPCIANGIICFEASSIALDTALNKYNQLKKAVKYENLSEDELERAVTEHRAVSPETIDEAADKLIDFAFSIVQKRKSAEIAKQKTVNISLRAAREAVVLLKNDKKTLPVAKGISACILGDIAMNESAGEFADEFTSFLEKAGINVLGKQRGYDLGKERSDALVPDAIELAARADIAFLFLGFGQKREAEIEQSQKLSLPANQIALLDKLSDYKCKIVAVVAGDYAADIVIDEKADALLFAPIGTEYSAEALAGIVSGEYSPCGKLAHTVYIDSDRILKKPKFHKLRDDMKSGPFMGYKYYDTAECYPKYPFGHGLAYTKFVYSNLYATEDTVTFSVKNVGKTRAAEIAQVYIGINDSAVLRPKKELCAFERIELEAGERQTVCLPLALPEVFNAESGQFEEEDGKYTVYVGSSVRDIRLMCDLYAGKAKLKPDGERKSDYLLSESNIISDNYKLEANCDIMRKSVLNIIAGAAALVLAVLLKVYCLASNTDALFFDILAVILAASGWVFFIAEMAARKKEEKSEQKNIEKVNEEAFEEAERITLSSAEQLFAKEFDVESEDVQIVPTEELSDGVEAENMVYVDNELDVATASRELSEAALEKGYKLEQSDACRIFSSMASSRVLLLRSMDEKAFGNFMKLLGNYFGTPAYIDSVNGAYENSEQLMFGKDSQNLRVKTNLLSALEAAQGEPQKIYFAGLDGVKPAQMPAWFAPVLKHAKNPYARHAFKAHNEQDLEMSYHFPQNVWFVVNMAEGSAISEIPANVAEIATVNAFEIKECEAVEKHIDFHKFSYYQMEYLCERLVAKLEIGEDVWKKIDKLEAFVNAHTKFAISNKLWLCLEKYVAVSMACGADDAVMDECVAAKLLPAIITALDGKMEKGETGLAETIEAIFGEDNVVACKNLIRACGADIV